MRLLRSRFRRRRNLTAANQHIFGYRGFFAAFGRSPDAPTSGQSRQRFRRVALKTQKYADAKAEQTARAEELAAYRTSPATVSLRQSLVLKERRRRESQVKRSRNRPFQHLHSVARQAALLAETEAYIRKSRAKKASA